MIITITIRNNNNNNNNNDDDVVCRLWRLSTETDEISDWWWLTEASELKYYRYIVLCIYRICKIISRISERRTSLHNNVRDQTIHRYSIIIILLILWDRYPLHDRQAVTSLVAHASSLATGGSYLRYEDIIFFYLQ